MTTIVEATVFAALIYLLAVAIYVAVERIVGWVLLVGADEGQE